MSKKMQTWCSHNSTRAESAGWRKVLSEANKKNQRGKGLETEKATALQTGREYKKCCMAEKEGRQRERKKWETDGESKQEWGWWISAEQVGQQRRYSYVIYWWGIEYADGAECRRGKACVAWKSLTLAVCAFPFTHIMHTNTLTHTPTHTRRPPIPSSLSSYSAYFFLSHSVCRSTSGSWPTNCICQSMGMWNSGAFLLHMNSLTFWKIRLFASLPRVRWADWCQCHVAQGHC